MSIKAVSFVEIFTEKSESASGDCYLRNGCFGCYFAIYFDVGFLAKAKGIQINGFINGLFWRKNGSNWVANARGDRRAELIFKKMAYSKTGKNGRTPETAQCKIG